MFPAAEGQCAAEVQVFNVDAVVLDPVVHAGRLARIPELVETIVALAVTKLQRHGEAAGLVEVASIAGFLVLEAAAHAIAAVQAHLELRHVLRAHGRREGEQGDGDENGAIQATPTIAHGP